MGICPTLLRGCKSDKEDPFLKFDLFFCPKIYKICHFSDSLVSQTAFFFRLGNLGGAMHPHPPHPPVTGMPSTCTLLVIPCCRPTCRPYSEPNLTAASKCKKPTWICVRQGWVCGCCPFSILCKHPPFFTISWDFDDLSWIHTNNASVFSSPYNACAFSFFGLTN